MELNVDDIRRRARVRRLYSRYAPIYDALVPAISSRARRRGREWLDVRAGESVLDVGMGTGQIVASLARSNPTGWTTGIDLTPAMVARASARLRKLSHTQWAVQTGRATNLPFRTDRFDAVFSSYLMDVLPLHLQRAALDEMYRVLRPGGRVLLVYVTTPRNLWGRLWHQVARHVPALLGDARPTILRSRLEHTGFKIDKRATCTQAGLRSRIIRATV